MNRNRVNKKRMGRVRVLSRAAAGMLAAALCFQPDDSAGRTGGRFFSYIVILECGAGRWFGQLQFGKYRQLWRFDFCF